MKTIICSAILCAVSALAACSGGNGPSTGTDNGPPGSVSIAVGTTIKKPALQKGIVADIVLADGDQLDDVSWTLANGTFSYTGTAHITGAPGDTTATFTIPGVHPGGGYTVAITGTTATLGQACAGTSASFNVNAAHVASITDAVSCGGLGSDAGAVAVGVTTTVPCPVLNWEIAEQTNLDTSTGGVAGVPGVDPGTPGTCDPGKVCSTTIYANASNGIDVVAPLTNGWPTGLPGWSVTDHQHIVLTNYTVIDANNFSATATCVASGQDTVEWGVQETGCPALYADTQLVTCL